MKHSSLMFALILTGCSTYSSNIRVGNTMDYVSLETQRQALTTVRQVEQLPPNAIKVGTVDAARCHRSFMEKKPTDQIVINDLKIAAYSQGADGITDVIVEHESGFTKNCWMIVDGQATIFKTK